MPDDDHPPPARAQQVAGREDQRQEDDEDPDRGDEPRGGDPRGRHEQRPVAAGGERRSFVLAPREADTREHAGHQEEPADHVLRASGRQDRADEAEVRRQEQEDQEERDVRQVATEQGRGRLDRERDERDDDDRRQDERRDAGATGPGVGSMGAAGRMPSRPQAAGTCVHRATVARDRSGSVTAHAPSADEWFGDTRRHTLVSTPPWPCR